MELDLCCTIFHPERADKWVSGANATIEIGCWSFLTKFLGLHLYVLQKRPWQPVFMNLYLTMSHEPWPWG
jgi:hypothetical protein